MIHDDAFWVKRQRWGTYVSVLADDTHLITALSEQQCVEATRWYLKARQDGFPEAAKYESFVGGKL